MFTSTSQQTPTASSIFYLKGQQSLCAGSHSTDASLVMSLFKFFDQCLLHSIMAFCRYMYKLDSGHPNNCSVPMPTHHESSSIQHCIVTAAINHMINPVQKNCKYLIIHSPQGFSGIIYNTVWGTLPDCLRCSLQVVKE